MWNYWYTSLCILYKRGAIVNSLNISYMETVSFEITKLDVCDYLDSNYTTIKINQISDKSEAELEKIKVEVASKLQELEKEKTVISKSFCWVVITVFSIFCVITILNDIVKLFFHLKNSYSNWNIKIKNKITLETTKNMNVEGSGIMLRQVIEKSKALSNHRYFQKPRDKVSREKKMVRN